MRAGEPARNPHGVTVTPVFHGVTFIPEGLVRYSVGIENADDLIADLRAALATGA